MCCVTAAVPKVFWEPGDMRLVHGEEINPRSKRHENLYVLMAGHFLGVRCCGLVAGRLLTCGLCRQENQPHRHVRGGSDETASKQISIFWSEAIAIYGCRLYSTERLVFRLVRMPPGPLALPTIR